MDMGSAFDFLASAGGHGAETDIISLISRASLVAKLVLVILVVMAVVTIALVISKWIQFRRATDENRQFLNVFWNEKSVEEAFSKSERFVKSPIAAVFKSGAREIKKISAANNNNSWNVDDHSLPNVGRALARSSNTEVSSLEKYLGTLAIMASAGPFIGLFGTVWGIMVSFQAIANSQNTNLAVVAPGIAEALFATAIGLLAAIPATIFYNMYTADAGKIGARLENFADEFSAIISRQLDERV